MSEIALRAERLGKRYRLGEREPYKTLRDVVATAVQRQLRRPGRAGRTARLGANAGEPVMRWVLRDVSFELRRGEVLGIIGHNGAGKSTLLKILSRITEPTEGWAELHGRVGALLEVGSGFHPELTGRENIYLNGIILGMRRTEIRRKFDQIVEFAEIEEFIDTPVKRYSSGMYTRLAFAVAAHLEPEILIVDEVLAVGDAAFQTKSLGRMSEVARGGRTILFVSHNLVAIQSICDRAIWLENGRIVQDGRPGAVVTEYLRTAKLVAPERLWNDVMDAPGNDDIRLRRVAVRPQSGSPGDPITVRTPVVIEFEYWNLNPGAYLTTSFHLYNEHGVLVFGSGPTYEKNWLGKPYPRGLFRDSCHIPGDLLNEGGHRVELQIVRDRSHILYHEDAVLAFDVQDSAEMRGDWYGEWAGAVRPILEWQTELLEESVPTEQ